MLDNSTGLRTVLGSDGVQEVTVAGRGTVQAHVFTLRVDMQAGEGCTSVALKDEKLREIEALPGIGLAVAASHAARGDSVQATRAVIKGGGTRACVCSVHPATAAAAIDSGCWLYLGCPQWRLPRP